MSMVLQESIHEILNTLADNYIPDGKHKYLHVDSRKAWVKIIADLLERGYIRFKMVHLVRFAKNWEVVLATKLSLLN